MSDQVAALPWWQTTKAIWGALILSLAVSFAPPLSAALWIYAFVAWRRRKTSLLALGGSLPAAGAAHPLPAGFHPMAEDPRSAWAYRRFIGGLQPGPFPPDLGARVLSMLEPGDHLELIADAMLVNGSRVTELEIKPRPQAPGILAIRTLRAWFFADRSNGQIIVIPGPVAGDRFTRTMHSVEWPVAGFVAQLTAAGNRLVTVKVFIDRADSIDFAILTRGAGPHIRRLPEAPEVPPAPAPETLRPAGSPVPFLPSGLPTDWKAAEEIAAAHMRFLGFPDADLTGAGRDGGIDVIASDAVAQVKMLALPVGAPPVQQLRGARPDMTDHLFYSTSGYTSAALAVADEIGVSLFVIDRFGAVEAANDAGRALVKVAEAAAADAALGPDVRQYAIEVSERVLAASQATDMNRAQHWERYPGQWRRISSYMSQALENLSERPAGFDSVKSAVTYFHHTELLAAVYFRELGIPYPQGAGDVVPDSLDEFYR